MFSLSDLLPSDFLHVSASLSVSDGADESVCGVLGDIKYLFIPNLTFFIIIAMIMAMHHLQYDRLRRHPCRQHDDQAGSITGNTLTVCQMPKALESFAHSRQNSKSRVRGAHLKQQPGNRRHSIKNGDKLS